MLCTSINIQSELGRANSLQTSARSLMVERPFVVYAIITISLKPGRRRFDSCRAHHTPRGDLLFLRVSMIHNSNIKLPQRREIFRLYSE